MPPLKLEVFELALEKQPSAVMVETSVVEDARLEGYEEGYGAGWEDATAAAQEETNRLGADLANNLQRLGFTFQEARTHLLRAVRPVVVQLATHLLPALAKEVLAPVVLDTITPLLDEAGDAPLRVILHPSSRPAVERLLTSASGLPLVIVEEPTLAAGQVYLQLGQSELRVDVDSAVKEILGAVHDFFEFAEKESEIG